MDKLNKNDKRASSGGVFRRMGGALKTTGKTALRVGKTCAGVLSTASKLLGNHCPAVVGRAAKLWADRVALPVDAASCALGGGCTDLMIDTAESFCKYALKFVPAPSKTLIVVAVVTIGTVCCYLYTEGRGNQTAPSLTIPQVEEAVRSVGLPDPKEVNVKPSASYNPNTAG